MLPDLILTGVLLVFAAWDLRFREIPLWAPAALFLSGVLLPHILPEFSVRLYGECYALAFVLPDSLLSLLPGALLIFISVLSRGGIGLGDGLFLLGLGPWLSPFQMICLLTGGFLCASIPAAVLLFRYRSRSVSFPFLPALFVGWLIGFMLSVRSA